MKKKNHRLPTFVLPHRYKIMLRPDLEKFTFSGEETILLTLKKTTKKIILHAAELGISHASITDAETSSSRMIGKVSFSEKEETVTLSFSKSLSLGEKALTLHFTGILNDKMRGFYRSKYEVDGQIMHMATTQFESTDARRAFPCIDEPAAKAIFDVTLQIPKETTAISNTIEEIVIEHESGYKIVQFSPTPKMSTYLLACIVGKFESFEMKTKEGIVVRVFTTPGKKKQAGFAAEVAVKILSFYNEYFGIAYPLPVLDLIAIPDFSAGAMENWGAVTFRESALLIDPEHSSSVNRQRVALIIAHELAHMWFGDLATMEWWTYLWLNEGFATYIEHVAIEQIFPEWHIWNQFIATEHSIALGLDGLQHTHPVEVPVHHPKEISAIFDQISYAKGASVLHMLATYLGPDDFRDGLRYYLKKFSYANATTEDLWRSFEAVSKKPIEKMMKNWIKKAGYPVITIAEEGKTFMLTQKRFFTSSLSSKKSKDTTIWHIPFTLFYTDTRQKEKHLMTGKTYVLPKTFGDWVKLNHEEASFVRVAYPSGWIISMATHVQNETLDATDRLGLVRDAFDLAAAGINRTDAPLQLATSYKDESEYIVWLEIASQLVRLGNLLAHERILVSRFNNYRKDLFATIAGKIGWEKKQHEPHTDALLRGIILYQFGKSGDQQTIQKAQQLFDQFIKNQTHIDPDIRSVVYNLVAQHGNQNTFDQFVGMYKNESMHQEKDRIARAMTTFDDRHILAQVLKWSLSTDVRPQDFPLIIYVLFSNPSAQAMTWEFIKTHWEDIQKKYSGMHIFSRIIENAGEFTDEKIAKDITMFFRKHPTPELARTVKQVTEQIYANVYWLKKDRKNIQQFLNSQRVKI